MTYDVENFRDDMLGIMQDNIDAKLAAITAEKGDGLVLPNFYDADLSESLFFNSVTEQIFSYNNFIMYNIEKVDVNTNGRNISFDVQMSFIANFVDGHDNTDAETKVLRVTRAMREVVLDNFRAKTNISNITIENIAPVSISLNGQSDDYKAGGVVLSATFAA